MHRLFRPVAAALHRPAVLVRPALYTTHVRLAASSPSAGVYGAPFTNSVTFAPAAPSSNSTGGILQPPQAYTFAFSIPDLPAAELRVHARDTLETISQLVAKALGAPVAVYSNGRRISAETLHTSTLVDLFGTALEFGVGDARYSVNAGLRLSAQGSTVKRTLLRGYVYLACGAGVIVVSSVLFWNAVVPSGHNRLKQLQRD